MLYLIIYNIKNVFESYILSYFKIAPPAGVILEAPFYNISQAAKEYVISPLFLNNPYSIKMAEDALEELEIRFNNAEK